MGREGNVEIFQDTERLCRTDKKLVKAVKKSNSRQYVKCENEPVKIQSIHRYSQPARIIVSKKRSLEAAAAYRGERICVHNFASALNPGGGVTHGASAQEEAICRCSTLYCNISVPDIVNKFHYRHRQLMRLKEMNVLYNDDCIFTPGVIAFKSDTSVPQLLAEDSWNQVDVITCAAPNLREYQISDEELLHIHEKRVGRICDIAVSENEEVLILGAFGCGAFRNSPYVVAEAMARVTEKYKFDFITIEFAVYCSPADGKNFEVFYERLGDR